jgi:hypothetical protein
MSAAKSSSVRGVDAHSFKLTERALGWPPTMPITPSMRMPEERGRGGGLFAGHNPPPRQAHSPDGMLMCFDVVRDEVARPAKSVHVVAARLRSRLLSRPNMWAMRSSGKASK